MSLIIPNAPASSLTLTPCFFEKAEAFLDMLLSQGKPRMRTESLTDEICLVQQASAHISLRTLDALVNHPAVQRRVHAGMLLHPDLVASMQDLCVKLS